MSFYEDYKYAIILSVGLLGFISLLGALALHFGIINPRKKRNKKKEKKNQENVKTPTTIRNVCLGIGISLVVVSLIWVGIDWYKQRQGTYQTVIVSAQDSDSDDDQAEEQDSPAVVHYSPTVVQVDDDGEDSDDDVLADMMITSGGDQRAIASTILKKKGPMSHRTMMMEATKRTGVINEDRIHHTDKDENPRRFLFKKQLFEEYKKIQIEENERLDGINWQYDKNDQRTDDINRFPMNRTPTHEEVLKFMYVYSHMEHPRTPHTYPNYFISHWLPAQPIQLKITRNKYLSDAQEDEVYPMFVTQSDLDEEEQEAGDTSSTEEEKQQQTKEKYKAGVRGLESDAEEEDE